MNILIVEDEIEKANSVIRFIEQAFPTYKLTLKESFNSAFREIKVNYQQYDLILLDMTMTTFDKSTDEDGGTPQILAGCNILESMKLRRILTPVVVVSMYESFDGKKMNELHNELLVKYPLNYNGHVKFAYNKRDWQIELSNYIKLIENGAS